MPPSVPSTPPARNRTLHYVGLAVLAIVVVVGIVLIL